MRYFSSRPPANRVAQIEQGKATGQLNGSAIIVVLALCCTAVALVIILEVLAFTPAL